jgi:hypothetical protein
VLTANRWGLGVSPSKGYSYISITAVDLKLTSWMWSYSYGSDVNKPKINICQCEQLIYY